MKAIIRELMRKPLHENDDVQPVRAVHTAHQRAHVRRGAWPGDENEIAIQTFAADAIAAKKIARRFDDIFGGEDGDVHAREKTDESGVIGIERNADGARARDAGESIRDADIRRTEFGFAAPCEHAGQTLARREKICRQIRGWGDGDAARRGRRAQDGAG